MNTTIRINAWLTLILCLALAGPTTAQNLAPSPEETNPLPAGVQAPDFTAYRVDGSAYQFDADALERPTVLITYRGGWCPYCNTQLQDLRHVLPEIKQSGCDVLFLSGDRPEILYSNLKNETQEVIAGLDYTILSDADMQMARAFGLAYQEEDSFIARRLERGNDIEESSMDKHKALGIPAVYVINTNGEIAFAHSDPNYRVRLPAEDVKAAVDEVLASGE